MRVNNVLTGLLLGMVCLLQDGWAKDVGFVENADEIVTTLIQKPAAGYSPTRSFSIPSQKTRAIVVRVKETSIQSPKDKEVFVADNSSAGVARLKVEFDVNSARLRRESFTLLDQLALAIGDARLSRQQICIKGHTDSDGSELYNLGLSYNRAEAVKEYLLARHDLKTRNLFVVGYGEQMPLAANDSPAHKQINRRVEITLGCAEVQ